jgi:hypothetical protein
VNKNAEGLNGERVGFVWVMSKSGRNLSKKAAI